MAERKEHKSVRDTVQEQMRELPVHATRLAMKGVGKAITLSDRLRRDYRQARETGLKPVLTRFRDDTGEFAGKVAGRVNEKISHRGRDKDSDDDLWSTASETDEPVKPKVNTSLSAEQPDEAPEISVGKPKPTNGAPSAEDLPVPDYDALSVASLRARLRNLSMAEVARLRDYEEANAARPNVITMYENRIAKLRAETG